jgi:hypothetical protein
MPSDHRAAAQDHLATLIRHLDGGLSPADRDKVISECEALIRAIRAFHMEGIRFRMFNVDRLLSAVEVPAEARRAFASARQELEAAGFHTRSHQAPS